MEPTTTNSTPEPGFDLETSFYGPGSLSAWYLTILCVGINWIVHPTKKFSKLSLSADLVVCALYACLAAGHMTFLLQHFDQQEMATVGRFLGYLATFRPLEWEPTDAAFKTKMEALNAPFRVGSAFFVMSGLTLIGIFRMEEPDLRQKPQKILPWVLFVAQAWVFGCLCFVAARCGLGAVLLAVGFSSMATTVLLACAITTPGGVVVLVAVILFVAIGGLVVAFWQLVIPTFEAVRNRRFKSLCKDALTGGNIGLFVFLTFVWAWISGSGVLYLWVMPEVVSTPIKALYPDLGVKMSAFDQILSLGAGIIALLFTVYACRNFFRDTFNE